MIVAALLSLAAAGEPGTSAPSQSGNGGATQGKEVGVTVKLEINETGVADKCDIVKTDAPAELAAKVCPIFLAKAKFKPQLDDKGAPKRASLVQTVKFVIQN